VKIHFDNVRFGAGTGPNTFATRLAKRLFELGHEVVQMGPEADVSLVFIEPSGAPLASKVVQRLDGIWFKPDEYAWKNRKIKDLYDKADAIVFQSRFDQGMVQHHWQCRLTTKDCVIANGIELDPIKQLTIPALVKLRQDYDQVFVCSSNWHAQKRLKSNVEMFLHLREKFSPNSCLVVMGNNPDCWVSDPHILFTGGQPPEVYMQVFAAANWMIHLAWLDHCPNVVIESLSQGTPVICSSSGGTCELVKGFGIVIDEKDPYGLELTDYDHPPSIDVQQVTSLPDKRSLGPHADIDIKAVAQKYIELFEGIA
jgi:glycosyltransferase involved in cell wall biosynthesis